MKTITITENILTPETIYSPDNATHKAIRDLVGFAVHTGRISDPVVGSAIGVLKEILTLEPNELYVLRCDTSSIRVRDVVQIVETALKGEMRLWRMSSRMMDRNRFVITEEVAKY